MSRFPRPALAPGEEWVWDYPRPPRVEPSARHVQVIFNNTVIADTRRAVRVLETSHPPVYYIPPEDVRMAHLRPAHGASYCEFKGRANYYTLTVGGATVEHAAWFYPEPAAGYETIAGYVAFYPGRMDACTVDGERVRPQEGDFYGGWITSEIIGPFKGAAGTLDW